MHTPSVHIGHQLIRVGKVGHFLEQPLKFDAVLGHARCINLFLKVWAVLLPGDRRPVGPTRCSGLHVLLGAGMGVEVAGVYRNAKSSRQTPRAIVTVSIAVRTISLLVIMLVSPLPVQDREDVYEGEIPEAHTEADRYHLEQRTNDQLLWHARYS
jgi:hypothetical protein